MNIVVPVGVPVLFMLLARLIPSPAATLARSRLPNLVQDGQLGWVALGFATSSSYEAYTYLRQGGSERAAWVEFALGTSILVIAVSAFMAAMGALFPYDSRQAASSGLRPKFRQYALFTGTLFSTAIAALLYCLLHYFPPGELVERCIGGNHG